jgi:hypothetical protein
MEENHTLTSNNSTTDFDTEEQTDLDNEIIDLKEPFDPKKIDIQVQQTTMDNLIKRLQHDEIDLNPDFQRSANLWRNELKCRLIESLLIKLPIPAFYFDATIDEKWQVVDGLQRLTAIKRYVIDQDLKLKGLEFLNDLDNKTYTELPRTFTRRIDEAPVTLYLIKPGTPINVKYSLFYRINTGGITLNPQEIRHALSHSINAGQASKFLSEIAESEIFKKYVRASNKRMLDKELILRFIAFKLSDYREYKGPMIKYLNDTMENLGKIDKQRLLELKNDFNKAVTLSWELFGEDAFRKSLVQTQSRKMINRALFEVVTTVFSNLNADERSKILANKETIIEEFKNLLNDDEFHNAISISTTYSDNVKFRFEKMNKIVSAALEED